MPRYDYECTACNNKFEAIHSMKERLKKCPKCKQDTLVRLIGSGIGLIFKGPGFYSTDYPKEK